MRRGRGRAVAAALALLALLAMPGCRGATTTSHRASPSPRPMLILEGPLTAQWHRLMRVSGAWARTGRVGDLPGRIAAVAPTGAVSAGDVERVVAWVRHGGRLVTADPVLLEALGVSRGPLQTVNAARQPSLGPLAIWPRPLQVAPLTASGAGRTFALGDSGAVLAAAQSVGTGGILAVALDPLAGSRFGYELLPSLGRDAVRWSGAPAGPERATAEVYLDPGGLHGSASGTPDQLADRLVGVRAVHIAGWNGDFRDRAANYDYGTLISALHARGILAYAWLEPPFVSLQMWEQHPECREKTATGRDAHVDWRLLMSLEDPGCYRLAWQVWQRLLTSYDWDGVNVAELYFEPPAPASSFTPFSAAALRGFGGDPLAEPERFQRYRTSLVAALSRALLTSLNGLPRARELELQLTVIDDVLDPGFARQLGVSGPALRAVAARAGAALQVEDPYPVWATSPLRYARLSALVSKAAPGAAVLDLNVVPRSEGRPMAAMTGAELDLAAGAAASVAGRVAFYALGTLTEDDLGHVSRAMSGVADTQDDTVTAPWAVTATSPARGFGQLTVDGRRWPVFQRRAVIPAGKHALRWQRGDEPVAGLRSLTGELGTASVSGRSLRFSYYARSRAYAVISQQPRSLRVDGRPVTPKGVRHPGGGWTIILPTGTHRVELQV